MLHRRTVLKTASLAALAMGLPARAQTTVRATLVVSPPDFAVPANATDTHVHVFEDPTRFPLAKDRTYTPGLATSADLNTHLGKLHCQRVVLVQPGPYGTDNSAILAAAKRFNGQARAVVFVANTITDKEMSALHDQGARAIRINLATPGVTEPSVALKMVNDAVNHIGGAAGWHIQIYTVLPVIAALRSRIESLSMPVVIDHFGRLEAAKGMNQPNLDVLFDLVKSGRVYVKVSAPHRISSMPDYADAAPYARALIAANPDRILWGSDWPHPDSPNGQLDKIFPFRNEDDGAGINRFARWAETPAMIERILVTNPARLFGWT